MKKLSSLYILVVKAHFKNNYQIMINTRQPPINCRSILKHRKLIKVMFLHKTIFKKIEFEINLNFQIWNILLQYTEHYKRFRLNAISIYRGYCVHFFDIFFHESCCCETDCKRQVVWKLVKRPKFCEFSSARLYLRINHRFLHKRTCWRLTGEYSKFQSNSRSLHPDQTLSS